uniref:Uncharacterized protein n=1 Tax=Anguilla anguilla TaxID=7936 RepID=A0A0E9UI83_ANGAN
MALVGVSELSLRTGERAVLWAQLLAFLSLNLIQFKLLY